MVWVEMPRKTPGPPCGVCREPSVAKGYCDKHYRRWKQYGDVGATLRPDDWGKRTKHPLAGNWYWTFRTAAGRVERWDDLYKFLEDVGEKPSPSHRLRRLDNSKPWGPDNFFWSQTLQGRHYSLETSEGKSEYQRVWRAANRARSKHHDLKKSFGITLERYEELLDAQGGTCAICWQQDAHFEHLAVDHCHTTKKIRGLLCSTCNRALGGFADDPERLRRALIYLTGSVTAPK